MFATSLEERWKTPLEKGFSKPFPKLFGLPSLRNGLRCIAMFHADCIIANRLIALRTREKEVTVPGQLADSFKECECEG